MSAPAILLAREPRFVLAHDALGFKIMIGEDCFVRPDPLGKLPSWAHAEGTNAEDFRRDLELLRAIIANTFTFKERRQLFGRNAHTARMQETLGAIIEVANEVTWEGRQADLIGREH